jgi:hypothetical protein
VTRKGEREVEQFDTRYFRLLLFALGVVHLSYPFFLIAWAALGGPSYLLSSLPSPLRWEASAQARSRIRSAKQFSVLLELGVSLYMHASRCLPGHDSLDSFRKTLEILAL